MSKEPFWTLNVMGGVSATLRLINLVLGRINRQYRQSFVLVQQRFDRHRQLQPATQIPVVRLAQARQTDSVSATIADAITHVLRPINPSFARSSQRLIVQRVGVGFLATLLAMTPSSFAADAIHVASPPAKLETNAVPDVMRTYLQLQEQLHSTQLAIERSRQETETAVTRNTEAVGAQLQALTDAASRNTEAVGTQLQSLADALLVQRAQELEAIRSANRHTITLGGAFAAVAFLAILLIAYFQWRAVSRITEFSVLSQASLTVGRGALATTATADTPPVPGTLPEQVNTRLVGALERLEKQILELEHTTRTPLGESNDNDGAVGGKTHRITLLLAKGESLLSLDKTGEALACYDEILALEPNHTEALVKKGDALERLRKIDDAISCYDRAIAADGTLTVAYLHKGGMFNRLERYEEALQCYEQALRTQRKSRAA